MKTMSFGSSIRWMLLILGSFAPISLTGCGCGGGGGDGGASATADEVETVSPPRDGRPPGEEGSGAPPRPSYDGKALTLIGEGAEGRASVRDSSDRVLVAGFAYDSKSGKDFALVRYLPEGTLDMSFGGGDGIVMTDVSGTGRDDEAYAIAIQPGNGYIVVAGYSDHGAYKDFAVVRYDIDGELDTSFGGDGMVTEVVGRIFPQGDHEIRALAIQADGMIVAAGYSNPAGTSGFAIARITGHGNLDTSFSEDGIAFSSLGGKGSSQANAIAIDVDQYLVAGFAAYQNRDGSWHEEFALAQFSSEGLVDRTIRTKVGSSNDRACAIALFGDRILLAGYSEQGSSAGPTARDFAVVGYSKSNWALDLGFGPGGTGKVTTPLGSGTDEARAISVLPDGKILLAGLYYEYWTSGGTTKMSASHFALVRYRADGALDTSFGIGGKVKTTVGRMEHDEVANSIALRWDGRVPMDGRFVVAGFARDPLPVMPGSPLRNNFAVVGYMADGSLDPSFGE